MPTDDTLHLERDGKAENIFVPSEWIGRGRPYPTDPPDYLSEAYGNAFSLSVELRTQLLPGYMTPVSKLVARKIPSQSNTLVLAKSDRWFSPDTPNTELLPLLDRPLPPPYILKGLRDISNQKWLDGMRSITDPRYNHGTERFPLCALTLWEELSAAGEGARSWKNAIAWLDSKVGDVPDGLIKECRAVLQTLGWKEMVHGTNFNELTLELTRILGSAPGTERKEWLAIGNMSLMLDHVRAQLDQSQPDSKILLPSPALMNELLRKRTDSKHPYSEKLAAQVIKEDIKFVYVVVHVDMCHWVAVRIDIVHSVIEYGMFFNLSP